MVQKPELLAPAGNLDKLKIAFRFGADAVYVGGKVFGLRKYADNFDLNDLEEGIKIANTLGKSIYVVLNGYAHNRDIDALTAHLGDMERLQPTAFIISDPGVCALARDRTSIDIHASTQASIQNHYGCQLWKNWGAKRIILGREVSIDACKQIMANIDIELEVFVHGAQCASYSGKCLISNYTAGRDANRGGCIQTCRHHFNIDVKGKTIDATLMNAKDQWGIAQIPALVEAGIASLKIEGRMKSNLYLANTVKQYREAIDAYCTKPSSFNSAPYEKELEKISNRSFGSGGLLDVPSEKSINRDFSGYVKKVDFMGTILASSAESGTILSLKNNLNRGDVIEIITPKSTIGNITVPNMYNMAGDIITKAKPSTVIKLPWIKEAKCYDIVRKSVSTKRKL